MPGCGLRQHTCPRFQPASNIDRCATFRAAPLRAYCAKAFHLHLRLSGSITALATPFGPTGEIDLDAWHRLLELQLAGGTQGIVVAGSTGEAAALYDGEYDTLLRSAVEFVAGRIPVLAGTGLSNTAKTI